MSPKLKPNQPLSTASVIDGSEQIRFSSDVAFDIETGPLDPSADDGSLLSAASARVAAIGYYEALRERFLIAYDKDEAAILRQFWNVYLAVNGSGFKLIGFNSHGFDLPFILRRSWFHGVPVPKNILSYGGRYWCETFVDLMAMWKCGSYKEFISLDTISKFFGVGEKNGNGERFHRLWDTNRKQAIDYLTNDVRLTLDCAKKMGVVSS